MRASGIWIGLLASGFTLPTASPAQTPASSSANPTAYEVVSIKPSKPETPSSLNTLPNGIRDTDTTLDVLVRNAFNVVDDDLLIGLPSWTDSEPYDIEAKVDADTAARWKKLSSADRRKEEQPMLQALLIDRCQLKFHYEKRESAVYDLVIAKSGLKMKEAPPNEIETEQMAGPGVTLTAHAISTESLISTLSGTDGRPVVDKTGLVGRRFDFTLHWSPIQRVSNADAGPSLFTALEEQLGLKLVPAKGTVNVLIIDQMERPSPN